MAGRKKKKSMAVSMDAPGWMVTFGDMMSLLLCFFVMLFSLSELKKNKLFDIAQAIKSTVGPDAVMATPQKNSREQTFMEVFQTITQSAHSKYAQAGGTHIRGAQGDENTVTVVREGLRVDLPERAGFDRSSAWLGPAARRSLESLAKQLVGMRQRVLVRGHGDAVPMAAEETIRNARWDLAAGDRVEAADKWALGYFRARAAADYLMELGVVPERIRITSCGRMEPSAEDLFSRTAQARNRRVEIVVSEEQIPAQGDAPVPR